MTFSGKIKEEYCALQWTDLCCIRAEMMGALVCSARFIGGRITLSTAHKAFTERISSFLREIYATDIKVSHGRELYTLSIDDRVAYDEIIADLSQSMGFDTTRGTVSEDSFGDECCGRAFLRGAFLASGSVSEPDKSYHLEFATRRISTANFIRTLLNREEISSGLLRRGGYNVVYVKEAQQLSNFLLVTGAHNAMLDLESLMVNKSVRNTVNRVVNCDNANSIRIAYTGARQQELIEYISLSIGLDNLPAELRDAANVRLENPDLSIKELAELMTPPIGKSGMYHRLKRLERLAEDSRGD